MEIYRSEGIHIHGKTVERTAVRGVIRRGGELLMVYSAAAGDYKFPGGGVKAGESRAAALRREIREECGLEMTGLGRKIGAVVEYKFSLEPDFDVFKMTSHFYPCRVAETAGEQQLDDYERELGFQPVWIGLEQALRCNRDLLGSLNAPDWLRREIFMLEYLRRGEKE